MKQELYGQNGDLKKFTLTQHKRIGSSTLR